MESERMTLKLSKSLSLLMIGSLLALRSEIATAQSVDRCVTIFTKSQKAQGVVLSGTFMEAIKNPHSIQVERKGGGITTLESENPFFDKFNGTLKKIAQPLVDLYLAHISPEQ